MILLDVSHIHRLIVQNEVNATRFKLRSMVEERENWRSFSMSTLLLISYTTTLTNKTLQFLNGLNRK